MPEMNEDERHKLRGDAAAEQMYAAHEGYARVLMEKLRDHPKYEVWILRMTKAMDDAAHEACQAALAESRKQLRSEADYWSEEARRTEQQIHEQGESE